ncbi:G-type lectin S-receptor-like serine/threonine-protein kinase B120 [Triticum aestivum]|uniref:G-type lectin S-receptor-like serine/threonine-protein kinase B120 n=1 Tax=Triticum aestivum TaxID=4565 RepID=UPI001D021C4E|nr:G-type lectin S-receptor-like serine/threonine-protein kinase B120 [Triticum aestivum]
MILQASRRPRMPMYSPLPVYAILLLLSWPFSSVPICSSDNRLVAGKPLSPGSVLVSQDGVFALGFFSPYNSTKNHHYVGIWYNDIPERTVVWVSNRAAPITTNLSSANLAVTGSSDIVLSDNNGRVFWTTYNSININSISVEAVLDNTGNFILRSLTDSTILWQSFDHPTDTLLPGMNLRLSHNTLPLQHLVSWKGLHDPSPGEFSYGADPSSLLQCFVWNGSRPHRRSPVWTNYLYVGGFNESTIYMALHHAGDEVYMSFIMPIGYFVLLVRMEIDYLGKVNLLIWESNMSAWRALYAEPQHECNMYGYCGLYGYCDNTEVVPVCKCLEGFEPRDGEGWIANGFSHGCRQKEVQRCTHGDGFLVFPGMKVPDKFIHVPSRSFDECTEECRSNCSCVAYAYSKMSNMDIDGDDTRCLVWMGDLIDMENHTQGGENLYVRTKRLQGNMRKIKILEIVLPVVSSFLILICVVPVWIYGSRDDTRKSLLNWPTRFKIIIGVARGLLYLHQDSRLVMIHRDLKAGNILLDAEMNPKISDFGTARVFGVNEHEQRTNQVVGTFGYMSPEYAMEGIISVKSDVYSFGVLILEIVSGMKTGTTTPKSSCACTHNLINYAWSLRKDGKLMDLIESSIIEDCSLAEALRCIHVGLLSVQDDPDARPLMSWVVASLDNKGIELAQPKEPMCFTHRKYGAGESHVHDMSLENLKGC